MNTYDEWARVMESYGDVLGTDGLQDLHVHLSGIEYTSKGEKNHLTLEEADLDLDALLRALYDFKCGGRILCESPVMEDDAIKIKQAWQLITGDVQDTDKG